MSSEPTEAHAGLVERTREVKATTLASAAQRLVARYDFFTRGTADHPAKYPEGGVPRWMIIGPVEDERIRAFEYLVRHGVLVKTADGSDENDARYRVIDDTTLSSIVAAHAPLPSDALEHAIRGVLANYSSGFGPYGVAESILIGSIPYGSVALDRLVEAQVLAPDPLSETMDTDERYYTLRPRAERSDENRPEHRQ